MNRYISWENNYLNADEYQRLDFNDFSNILSIQPKSTSQGSSGRCWIFAALNTLRIPFIKKNNLGIDFEFSQNFLFFWDKYSRCEYFLKTYPSLPDNKRLNDAFMRSPVVDGGQWSMFVNLINKYGIVPKSCYSDTYNSKDSKRINMILNNLLKNAILKNLDPETVLTEVKEILESFLGKPPAFFNYKNVKYTPLSFYESQVKTLIDVNEYITLINDPRNEYNKYYTIEYLNNMVSGDFPLYLNVEMSIIKRLSIESILQDLPVWFGADVMPYTSRELCISGINYFKYPLLCSKKERLETFDSSMTHAMVLHGFNNSEEGGIEKWKVENSWGTNGPYGGYYIMDDKWFDTFVYQVSIHKSIALQFIDHRLFKDNTLNFKSSIKLPLWDSFGSLAKKVIKRKFRKLNTVKYIRPRMYIRL